MKIVQAEDTFNLLDHIAWTDVIKPKLLDRKEIYSKMLVADLLGQPLTPPLTKEQVAGKIYGINEIITVIEGVLTQGQKALDNLRSDGILL